MLESTYGHRHITYLDENKMYIKLFERKFEVLWKQKKAKLPKMDTTSEFAMLKVFSYFCDMSLF